MINCEHYQDLRDGKGCCGKTEPMKAGALIAMSGPSEVLTVESVARADAFSEIITMLQVKSTIALERRGRMTIRPVRRNHQTKPARIGSAIGRN